MDVDCNRDIATLLKYPTLTWLPLTGSWHYCQIFHGTRNWVMMMKTSLHMRACYDWHKIKYLVICRPLYTETYYIYDVMKYSSLMLGHLYLSPRILQAPENVLCIHKMYISYKKICTEILIIFPWTLCIIFCTIGHT